MISNRRKDAENGLLTILLLFMLKNVDFAASQEGYWNFLENLKKCTQLRDNTYSKYLLLNEVAKALLFKVLTKWFLGHGWDVFLALNL